MAVDYVGPQRTPEDPTKPNANLYVLERSSGKPRVRQLTWQLNMERLPSFMQDGRLVFTSEKRAPGFYQLALRRQNLDGGDYHPLYAQRSSIGFTQATYAVELSDKNFATIFSDQNARHGAGALGVFNRSIGIDFTSPTPSDYLIDPSVIKAGSASAPEGSFFKHSLSMVVKDGSYTSPSPLPDGKMLVSYGSGAPASFGGDYDVYVLDPVSGKKTKLLGNAGTAELEAVAVYARTDKGVFASTPDEPNANTYIQPGVQPGSSSPADVTVLDMTVLASLLFQNTPTGRVIESDLKSFDIYEDLPPEPGVTSFSGCGGNTSCDSYGKVYVRRRLLGSGPHPGGRFGPFSHPRGPADRLASPRRRRVADVETAALAAGRDDLPARRAHASVLSAEVLRQPVRSLPRRRQRPPLDAALLPDFLTQASNVDVVTIGPTDYSGPPSGRGDIIGPPSSP